MNPFIWPKHKMLNSPQVRKWEGEMAELACDWCGHVRMLQWMAPSHASAGRDIIRGVLKCRLCDKETIFGMTDNSKSFYPTKGVYGELSGKIPPKVEALFKDAELCFYGGGFRGAVAMCRACVEDALEQTGVKTGRLEDMIDEAESTKMLGKTEFMLAHGSRLTGNAALHKAETLEPSSIPAVLSATIMIVNHLFP